MKLDAGDLPVLDDCRERFAVLGDGDCVAGHRHDVAVGKVHLFARGNAVQNRCVARDDEAVPADVLSAALYVRFRSRQQHTFAEKMLSAMRQKFGGHVEAGTAKAKKSA